MPYYSYVHLLPASKNHPLNSRDKNKKHPYNIHKVRKTNENCALKSGRRLFPLFAALLTIMAACSHDPFFIPVKSIEGVPETGTARSPLILTGTVIPGSASKNAIEWLVKDPETTGASIDGNILNTQAEGFVIITAKIINGIAEGKDYTQDFHIVFK